MFTTPSADVHTPGVTAMWVKDTATVTANGCGVSNVLGDKNKKKLLFPSMGSTSSGVGDDCASLRNGEKASNSTTAVTATVIRDHDSAIVELGVFMVLTSFDESSSYGSGDSGDGYGVDDPESPMNKLYDTISAVFVNVLRCYGRRLGEKERKKDHRNYQLFDVYIIVTQKHNTQTHTFIMAVFHCAVSMFYYAFPFYDNYTLTSIVYYICIYVMCVCLCILFATGCSVRWLD
jgi:hypothetical protein